MALDPTDDKHALQILAGIHGRRAGHDYERGLAALLNDSPAIRSHRSRLDFLISGSLRETVIDHALDLAGWSDCESIEALSLGGLATDESDKKSLEVRGSRIKACKSDVLLLLSKGGQTKTVGISVKQCNKRQPTNAQLYFTTASAFCNLLKTNGIEVSDSALIAMRQFCGDAGFRPIDDEKYRTRRVDPRRFFWEEILPEGRSALTSIFTSHQDLITKILLQKAYLDDPFPPQILIHKTRLMGAAEQEFAVFKIDDLVKYSSDYSGFNVKKYSIKKGTYKDPAGVEHEAPRFGFVQMQRGGQKQHPTQLQFNLQSAYFYKIPRP